MSRVMVHVTQELITYGQTTKHSVFRSSTCPVALALQAAGFKGAAVGGTTGYFYGPNGHHYSIRFSPKVATFVNRADNRNLALEPFSFVIENRPFC